MDLDREIGKIESALRELEEAGFAERFGEVWRLTEAGNARSPN